MEFLQGQWCGNETQCELILVRKLRGNDERSFAVEGNVALVKENIEPGFKEEAVVGIQALVVIGIFPRLGVACAEKIRTRNARNGATSAPHL
jgi:hypothetical protein